MPTTVYYRYSDPRFGATCPWCETFRVRRTTPKGVWVEDLGVIKEERFILNGARKRYAYPTKEEALNSYKIRKLFQVGHAENSLRRAKHMLEILKEAPTPSDLDKLNQEMLVKPTLLPFPL